MQQSRGQCRPVAKEKNERFVQLRWHVAQARRGASEVPFQYRPCSSRNGHLWRPSGPRLRCWR
jgi:hypothetical protein